MDTNASSQQHQQHDEQFANDFYYSLWTFVTPTLFSLVLLVGASGNSLVIYVILSRREMRSITNLMLVNLAVADLAFLFTTVPFTAIKYAADTWPFDDATCKVGLRSKYRVKGDKCRLLRGRMPKSVARCSIPFQ